MTYNILVALYSYTHDEHVFTRSLALAKAKGADATLHLVHVRTENEPRNKATTEPVKLRKAEALAAGVNASCKILEGNPGRKICQQAEAINADVIVMGHRGQPHWHELGAGSISDYVVKHAPCAVLVIRPPLRIMVAMAKPDDDRAVFDRAELLAKRLNASLTLLHVTPKAKKQPAPAANNNKSDAAATTNKPGPAAESKKWDCMPKTEETATNNKSLTVKQLELLAAEATARGVNTRFASEAGPCGQSICDYAKTQDMTLIVLGSHQRAGLGEIVQGSVSMYVVSHAPCGVMVIPKAAVAPAATRSAATASAS